MFWTTNGFISPYLSREGWRSTCMGTQSLSWSLAGLWEAEDWGVPACGGLWTINTIMIFFPHKKNPFKFPEDIPDDFPASLTTLPAHTLTSLYSSHTPAAPPVESSLAPPAGWRRCCPPAPSGSPCGSQPRSAPPARPTSLREKNAGGSPQPRPHVNSILLNRHQHQRC